MKPNQTILYTEQDFDEFYENVSLLVAALILSSWSTLSRLESFATSPLSQRDNLCKVSSLTNCQHFQVVVKILFFLFFHHLWSSSNCQHYQSCQVVVKIILFLCSTTLVLKQLSSCQVVVKILFFWFFSSLVLKQLSTSSSCSTSSSPSGCQHL